MKKFYEIIATLPPAVLHEVLDFVCIDRPTGAEIEYDPLRNRLEGVCDYRTRELAASEG